MKTSRVLGVGIALAFLVGPVPSIQASSSSSCPSCVTLSPHGVLDWLLDRDGGYRAVRFDPPFQVPYTIRSVTFESWTQSRVPARFPSVRLCGTDAIGRPNIASPLVLLAPYEGSADGPNTIPLDLAITEPGRTFFWVIEFPRRDATGPEQPFVRDELVDAESGFFGATYDINPSGLVFAGGGGNLGVDLTCELPSSSLVPLAAPSNLGANWRGANLEFSFRPATDATSDPARDLRQTILMLRGDFGHWRPFAATGRGGNTISVPIDSIPLGAKWWTAASLDRWGNLSAQSSVVIALSTNSRSEFTYDVFEPNGSRNQASTLPASADLNHAAIYPAGDRDFYRLQAGEGDLIHASAGATGGVPSTFDHLRLALALYDASGKLVALSDGSIGDTAPIIDYLVPPRPGDASRRQFTLEVLDPRGNWVLPNENRRSGLNALYFLTASVDEGPIASGKQTQAAPKLSAEPSSGGGATFRIALAAGMPEASGPGVLRIFDVQGRSIRTLAVHASDASRALEIGWDGRGSNGDRVTSGVYFARFTLGGHTATCKAVVTR